ncbi:MAG: hypothetical protein U0892_00510 [Pirellulales bacterium]
MSDSIVDAPAANSASTFERLPVSFERLIEQLQVLPRMFVELDGSFVWTGTIVETCDTWQLDGMIYDDGDRVLYIELKGCCTAEEWRQLLTATTAEPDLMTVELVESGRIVSGHAFERLVGLG